MVCTDGNTGRQALAPSACGKFLFRKSDPGLSPIHLACAQGNIYEITFFKIVYMLLDEKTLFSQKKYIRLAVFRNHIYENGLFQTIPSFLLYTIFKYGNLYI